MGTCFIFSKQIKKGLSELKHWKMGEHPHNRQKKKKIQCKKKNTGADDESRETWAKT
jgi:hypothetical protein